MERIFGDDTPIEFRGKTLDEIRREQALHGLSMLVMKLSARAFGRVFDTFYARLRERGLDEQTATVGDVIDDAECVALFTAGLYGEGTS
jgi:hypothetical protein